MKDSINLIISVIKSNEEEEEEEEEEKPSVSPYQINKCIKKSKII